MNKLNENEQEVLRILWESPDLKPAEIQTAFGWGIENATLRSVLRNLLDKELIVRQKSGKAFLYRARARRRTQLGRAVQRMAEIFTNGSKADLILELLHHEKLNADELLMLQKIAKRKEDKSER